MQKTHSFLILLITILGLSACKFDGGAQKIVDQSIKFYGMDKLDGKTVTFDFREFHYTIKLNGGDYFYERSFTDSTLGKVKDQLSNHGFVREINGLITPQTEKDSLKYAASVNSVVYFSFLPLKLNDDATQKKFLKTTMVNGKEYDLIEVSFQKDKGGKDHDDTYYFWFDGFDHSMDYFAYSSGGNRFRAINGLVQSGDFFFQNYKNLVAKEGVKTPLIRYDKLFEEDKLIKLSDITLENLKVE
ncbi:MAG: DUF6503 family protein [Pelobium sp.]